MKKPSCAISNLYMSMIFFNMRVNFCHWRLFSTCFGIYGRIELLQNSSCLFLFPRKILNQRIHELLQPARLCK